MQVSSMSDSITHAVLGKAESVEMGVSDSAALMHIFSTALYTHPRLAAVREIICNGWDGHITTGRTDKPLQITLTDQQLIIRDFGPGIPHERIGPIYGVFGGSTKRDDSTVTGGFGLGSKAPFAYVDNFEVISHHEGTKSIYRMSKSSMERQGKPTIDLIVQLPTEESGIQVTMDLSSWTHMPEFKRLVTEVVVLGEIKAELNGEEIVTLPLLDSPTGYIIHSVQGTILEDINLRYGNVMYPIPRREEYGEIWDSICRVLSHNLWQGSKVTFLAPPDSVTIAPNREALVLMDNTIQTIKEVLGKFNPEEAKTSVLHSRQLTASQANSLLIQRPGPTTIKDVNAEIHLPVILGAQLNHDSGPYAYTVRKAAVRQMLSKRLLIAKGDKYAFDSVKHGMYKGTIDKVMGKRFLKAARRWKYVKSGKAGHHKEGVINNILQAVADRYIKVPLLKLLDEHKLLIDIERFSMTEQKYYHGGMKLTSIKRWETGGIDGFLSLLYPKILLARSKAVINDFMSGKHYTFGTMSGWMVYQLPSEKNLEEIQKVFEDAGYRVHVDIPARAARELDPDRVLAERKKTVKRKGFLSLASSFDAESDKYLLTAARANCKPEDHVFDPVAYVVLMDKANSSTYELPQCTSEISSKIVAHFGKQIAVISTNQVQGFIDKGIPEMTDYIVDYVEEKLMAQPDFPRYLAFQRHFKKDDVRSHNKVVLGATRHKALMDELGLRFHISAETAMLITFLEDDSYYGFGKKLKKCIEFGRKVPPHKAVKVIQEKIQNSEWTQYLDMDRVGIHLQCFSEGSPKSAVPYEIVRNLLK